MVGWHKGPYAQLWRRQIGGYISAPSKRHCKTFKFELPHSCFVESVSYSHLNLRRPMFLAVLNRRRRR